MRFSDSNSLFILQLLKHFRLDQDQAERTTLTKVLREVENAKSELQEDLEAERVQRAKSEKNKRDLKEELDALKAELEDSIDSTTAQQETRFVYCWLHLYG